MVDLKRFQNAIALRDSRHVAEALREFGLLETQVDSVDEKAALMGNEHRCYCDLGRLVEAERIMAEIRKLAPTDPDVLLNIDYGEACMHVQMGQLEKGLFEFGQILHRYSALLRSPDSDFRAVIQKKRGIAVAKLGRYAEAIGPLGEAAAFGALSDEDK